MKPRIRRAALCTAIMMLFSSPHAFAGKANLGGLANGTEFDQFIVKYRDGSDERRDSGAIDRGLAQAARTVVGTARRPSPTAKHLRRMSLDADVVRTSRKLDRIDAETLMRAIAADPNVEYVEVDALMQPALTPNDPLYPQQWHYMNNAGGIHGLTTAWDKSTGATIVIAVIDTGSTPHSDLAANTLAGYDFISDANVAQDGGGRDNNPNDPGDWYTNWACGGYPDPRYERADSSWHGTHVAGTIAAVTNNANGVAGVAFGARIQHARALGRCGGSTSDIADAIVWASGGNVSGVPANATPAQIINMSLGGNGSCSSTFQNAINTAAGRGTTVVVAAGNLNTNAANYQPASCANTITVGANDANGGRASFSNYGRAVDIAAPGVNVLSTRNTGTQAQGAETYSSMSGTSMAAPHVAGVAALVQSRRVALGLPQYAPTALETLLKSTARPFPTTPSQAIGVGIVNPDAAVTEAEPKPAKINSFYCSGQGSGYCQVTATGTGPITIQWTGGFGTGRNDNVFLGVCGTYVNVPLLITATVSNAYGSESRSTTVTCNGGPEP